MALHIRRPIFTLVFFGSGLRHCYLFLLVLVKFENLLSYEPIDHLLEAKVHLQLHFSKS